MKKSLIASLGMTAALAGMMCGSSAIAAERGFYVGLNYGQLKKDSEQTFYDNEAYFDIFRVIGFEPVTVQTSLDTKDSTYGFFGGWRMSEYLAIEGGFVDTGEVRYRNFATGISHRRDELLEDETIDHSEDSEESWQAGVRTRSKSMAISALGIYPMTYRSEAFVRAGVMVSSNDFVLSVRNDTASASVRSQSKTSFDPVVGLGFGYTFAEIYMLRVEYQRIFDQGYKDFDEADADLFSIGVTVTF